MPAFFEEIPVIVSLIAIEGLLSVDNALAIAAMASHLPEKQKYLALRFGIIGAYGFRGLSLAFAAWIVENPWLKIIGAAYLVYLMCHHFTGQDSADAAAEEGTGGPLRSTIGRGFIATVIAIELMDLSLSVDNVVAAVAMSPKLWVVCTGVFIGILALRFVAGACIQLIARFPILEQTAFLLIGYVGFILLFELLSDPQSHLQLLPGPVHVTALQKFTGIAAIIALSLGYAQSSAMQKALAPLFASLMPAMRAVTLLFGSVLGVVLFPFKLALRGIQQKPPA
jgi:YkoY family integral membrane protein